MASKIVDFHKWCASCKYRDNEAYKDPCNECLNNPSNEDSTKPINWKKDKKAKDK